MFATILFRIICLPICCQKGEDKIYETVILLTFLCGCDTFVLTLLEEQTKGVKKQGSTGGRNRRMKKIL